MSSRHPIFVRARATTLGALLLVTFLMTLVAPACTFLPEKQWQPGMVFLDPLDPVTKVKAVVHFPSSDWKALVREERDAVSKGEPAYVVAFRELQRGPSAGQGVPSVPAGTLLLSDPILSAGVLYLNFSKEMTEIRSTPAAVERLILQSLVFTLTEVKEVTAVQVLVDGQKIKAAAGRADVSRPLRRQDFVQQGGGGK